MNGSQKGIHTPLADGTEERGRLLEITEAKRAMLYNLFMQAPAFICILTGPDHIYEFVNPIFQSLFPGRTIVGKPIREGVPERENRGVFELLDRVYSKGEPQTGSEFLLRIDRTGTGDLVDGYFNFVFQPVRSRSNAVDCIIVYAHEITEQVLSRKAIEESAHRYYIVLEALPQMAWTSLPDGTIEYFNKRWYDYTGLSENGNLTESWTKVLHPEDLEKTVECWEKALRTGENFEHEARLLRASDGAMRWHLKRSVPILNDKGEILLWVGTCTDIHDQIVTQVKLRQAYDDMEERVVLRTKELSEANKELGRSNQDLEQFAYVASHDLKEPLRMVSSYAQLLSRLYGSKLDSDAVEFIKYITEGAHRMQSLINDLLNYSRIGRIDAEIKDVDLNTILDIVKTNLGEKIAAADVIIKYSKLPVINGIESQLLQLFQNLIENAIKFRSEAQPEILINAERKAGHWLFSVKDNGIGIPDQHIERVFVIFQRLHERNKYPGTGMGLAICKKIVELHGGKIWIDSEEGKGTTFFFTLFDTFSLNN
ncbi:MAG: ATP-binding protein [Bacteroidota bacterium]|nr:ATP-binding protein [Bacteroidota bacterium]